MQFIEDIASLRDLISRQKADGHSIGLVPTMGNLHAGHMKLVETALAESDFVITSLFVNPLQFGPGEDLHAYPRTLQADRRKLEAAGCHVLFAPGAKEIYASAPESQSMVHVPGLSEVFCGASRPGHFDGVATVVTKLFNIVNPDLACFGLKDYQQFLVISKLVEDLHIEVELRGVETVRESNGLALSSRNNYLSQGELATASQLYTTLKQARDSILNGNKEYRSLELSSSEQLAKSGFKLDYFAICDANTLEPAVDETRQLVILSAVHLGTTRLIDNLRLSLPDEVP
jgi:pantoate--beta-alanine ligase